MTGLISLGGAVKLCMAAEPASLLSKQSNSKGFDIRGLLHGPHGNDCNILYTAVPYSSQKACAKHREILSKTVSSRLV